MRLTRESRHTTSQRGTWRRFKVQLPGTCALAAFLLATWLAAPIPQGWANALKKIQQEQKRCFGLYRKKNFPAAITCYSALRKLNKNAQYLVNIAQSYRLEALKNPNTPEAAILQEKSIETFKQYKKEAPHANFWTNKMIQKLEKAIGYANVSLASTPPDAQFVLKGYQYSKSGKLPQQLKLRPGKYTLALTAQGHLPKEHKFTITPSMDKKLSFVLVAVRKPVEPRIKKPEKRLFVEPRKDPPQSKPGGGPGMLPWIAVAAGGALIVTGIVFVGLSASASGQLDDPNTSAKQAQDALYQRGWQTPVGWTFIGLGVAAGVGAVVLFLLPRKNAEPRKPTAPKNASLPPTQPRAAVHLHLP